MFLVLLLISFVHHCAASISYECVFESPVAAGILLIDDAGHLWGTLLNLPVGMHGLHLHSLVVAAPGFVEGGCAAVGAHYDGANNNSHPNHLGDLGYINILNDSVAYVDLQLNSMDLSSFNRRVLVVHERQDVGASDAGGARLACCILRPPSESSQFNPTVLYLNQKATSLNSIEAAHGIVVIEPAVPPFSYESINRTLLIDFDASLVEVGSEMQSMIVLGAHSHADLQLDVINNASIRIMVPATFSSLIVFQYALVLNDKVSALKFNGPDRTLLLYGKDRNVTIEFGSTSGVCWRPRVRATASVATAAAVGSSTIQLNDSCQSTATCPFPYSPWIYGSTTTIYSSGLVQLLSSLSLSSSSSSLFEVGIAYCSAPPTPHPPSPPLFDCKACTSNADLNMVCSQDKLRCECKLGYFASTSGCECDFGYDGGRHCDVDFEPAACGKCCLPPNWAHHCNRLRDASGTCCPMASDMCCFAPRFTWFGDVVHIGAYECCSSGEEVCVKNASISQYEGLVQDRCVLDKSSQLNDNKGGLSAGAAAAVAVLVAVVVIGVVVGVGGAYAYRKKRRIAHI